MDLKPCPFCGKIPVTEYETKYSEQARSLLVYVKIICRGCNISREGILPSQGKADLIVNKIQELENAWNRRA